MRAILRTASIASIARFSSLAILLAVGTAAFLDGSPGANRRTSVAPAPLLARATTTTGAGGRNLCNSAGPCGPTAPANASTTPANRAVPFGHDALLDDAKAFDPGKLQALVNAGVTRLEIDLGYRPQDGRFYVSHFGDASDIASAELSQREFVTVLNTFHFAALGLKPHLDIKFADTAEAVTRFDQTLNSLPTDLDVTISGHDWSLLTKLAVNPRVGRTLFTIDSQDQVATFCAQAATLQQELPGAIGVSLRDDLATPQNLQSLNAVVRSIVVWTVNSRSDATALVAQGVFGITTDSVNLAASLLPARAQN